MPETVVFIHGWASCNAIWQPLIDELGDIQTRCLALPGYEQNETTWQDPIDYIAKQLPYQCHVVAWSLGANVAMAVADIAPQVQSVTTIAALPCFVANTGWPWAMEPSVFKTFYNGFVQQPDITIKRFVALQSKGDDESRAVAKALKALPCYASNEVLQQSLRWLGETNQANLWQSINTPHMAIFGSEDALVPQLAAQELSNSCVIAGCGHAPMISKPQQLAETLKTFWQA